MNILFPPNVATVQKYPPRFRPFDPGLIGVLNAISQAILTHAAAKAFSDLVALAFWLRKSNITRIATDFATRTTGRHRLPRGTVLHFAPSNVDTIFVYSAMIALVLGNPSIVRLPSRETQRQLILIDCITTVLGHPDHAKYAELLTLIRYGHNSETTAMLSGLCEARVIWGGDQSVIEISKTPVGPKAVDIKFSSKRSMAIISEFHCAALSDSELAQAAKQFVNDSFWFGQLGCSSPRVVVWVGGAENHDHRTRFWAHVNDAIHSVQHEIGAAELISKLTTVYGAAMHDAMTVHATPSQLVTRVELRELADYPALPHCGYGLFYESSIATLSELGAGLTPDLQTISYLGFSPDELATIPALVPTGIDRIVPFGTALDFDYVWDGWDLTTTLTREVWIS